MADAVRTGIRDGFQQIEGLDVEGELEVLLVWRSTGAQTYLDVAEHHRPNESFPFERRGPGLCLTPSEWARLLPLIRDELAKSEEVS